MCAVVANYFVQGGEGTPLAIAAKCGNTEMVECMLNAGADPNIAEVIQNSIEPITISLFSCSLLISYHSTAQDV